MIVHTWTYGSFYIGSVPTGKELPRQTRVSICLRPDTDLNANANEPRQIQMPRAGQIDILHASGVFAFNCE